VTEKIGLLAIMANVTLQPTRVGSTRRQSLSGPCTFDGGEIGSTDGK